LLTLGRTSLRVGPRFVELDPKSTVLWVDLVQHSRDVSQCPRATLHRDVVGTLWHARTVEADLGMRWNAEGIVAAALRERMPVPDDVARYAADPGRLGGPSGDCEAEEQLATATVLLALRRHSRRGR
jgi:hypothetical protein